MIYFFLYQIDLVDMTKFENENDGYRWIITIIDTFSKKAWAFKIKRKSAKAIMTVMTPFCRDNKPVMHAVPFSVNRRRRAQNGTGAAAFGGVGHEISKIHIPISHDKKLFYCFDFIQNNKNR